MLRPTRKIRSLRGAGFSGPTRPPRPDQIDRYPNQNYLQALSRGLRLVEQENKHDTDRRKYVDRYHVCSPALPDANLGKGPGDSFDWGTGLSDLVLVVASDR